MQIHAYKRSETTATPQQSQQTWQKVSLDLDELCRHAGSEDSSLIAFLDSDELNSQAPPDIQKRLSTTFSIPPLFWTKLCQKASGFFWAKEETGQPTTTNQASSSSTCFRFLIKHGPPPSRQIAPQTLPYHWEELGFASHRSPQSGLVMLCFDVPTKLEDQIGEAILTGDAAKYGQGPFSLHALLMSHIVERFDRAVWSWRDIVRDLEKTRSREDASKKRSFEHMHEAARHVIHCSEMLETAIAVTESVVREVRGVSLLQQPGDPASPTIVKDLEFCISLLTCLWNRSQATEKRLENEINLALHLSAQSDSLVTIRIAELTHRDGQIMKGIGMLGMVFLPGTFVSAIFSMSFFSTTGDPNNGTEKWTLSDRFWLYWVVALPLTALTLAVWYCWQKGYIRRWARRMP